MNIFDLITAKILKDYWEETPSSKIDYLGGALFPTEKSIGLELSFIKGKDGLPVTLKSSAFDSDVPFRDRVGLEKLTQDMPFFREGMMIKEKDRQELLKVVASGNQLFINIMLKKIFNDKTGLIASSYVTKERMIMQLLAYGLITLNVQGSPVNYDYDFNPDHKLFLSTATDKWTDLENSDPIDDILTMQEKVEDDTGVLPTRAICTRATRNLIKNNKKVLDEIKITQKYMTDEVFDNYFYDKTKMHLAVYNKKYGNGQLFYPENHFSMIPEGNLGNFYYGTTPEEADLTAVQGNGLSIEVIDKGVAVSVQAKKDSPVNVKTIVSMIGLPSAETMNNWGIISW